MVECIMDNKEGPYRRGADNKANKESLVGAGAWRWLCCWQPLMSSKIRSGEVRYRVGDGDQTGSGAWLTVLIVDSIRIL